MASGSNPLSSTRKSARAAPGSRSPQSLDNLVVDSRSIEHEIDAGLRQRPLAERIEKSSVTLGKEVNGWRTGLNSGDRAYYGGDWLRRAAVALAGIHANDPAEALYPTTHVDSTGAKLDGATSRYTITFPSGQFPPVNAFWSVTMYDGKTQLLVANPTNRYLINSPMLPDLKKNGDGSVTLYVQKDSPGADKESNWLPASNDEFYTVMRLYWPKQAALSGEWKAPAVQPAN
jgi:hypothetical protein